MTAKQVYDSEVIQILSNAAVSRINFSLGGLHINSDGFARIRRAIQNGHIKVNGSRTLPEAASASYGADENVLTISPDLNLGTRSGQAVVIHECVHAIVDAARASSTTVASNEAAAYIAQVIYRMANGEHRMIGNAAQDRGPGGSIFRAAVEIVNRFGLHYRGAVLQLADYAHLRQAIAQHPLYGRSSCTARTAADGIGRAAG